MDANAVATVQRLDDVAFLLLLEMHAAAVTKAAKELEELGVVSKVLRAEVARRRATLDAAGAAVASTLARVGEPGPS